MENWKKGRLILFAMINLGLLFLSPLEAAKVSKMRLSMGTLLQIEVEATDSALAEEVVESGFLEVDQLEKILSNYLQDSEISRINRDGFLNEIILSEEMNYFIQQSIQLSQSTQGSFDLTVEPLTQLWNLKNRTLEKFPTSSEIQSAKDKVGYQNLNFSYQNKTFRFNIKGMGLDTGGIGKGYALDRALEKMKKFPIQSATLNFGGEILYWSETAQKREAEIRNPLSSENVWRQITFSIDPKGVAVSTSGNYERFVTLEGKNKKIGHILNPKTGEPVDNELRSVTVLAPTATIADAYSTAFFVMGLEESKNFLKKQEDVSALLLYLSKKGELESFLYSNPQQKLVLE